MRWLKFKKNNALLSNQEVDLSIENRLPENGQDVNHYKHINYGVLHIEKKIEEFMDEEVVVFKSVQDNFQYALDVQKDFKEVNNCTKEVKQFSNHIITGIEQTSAEIYGAATGVGSVAEVVDSMGIKLEELNLRMSKRSTIICNITDFLQQIDNLTDKEFPRL